MKHIIAGLLFCLSPTLFSDILGSFQDTNLHPGYLDLADKAYAYKGNIDQHHYDDSVERRTPSQILKSYLDQDMKFNFAEAERFLFSVKELQQNAFLAFCSTKLDSKISKSHSACKSIDWQNPMQPIPKELDDFLEKWRKNEANLTCNLAISKMQATMKAAADVDFNLINDPRYFAFIEDFFTAIEAFEAVKAEDSAWGRSTSHIKYNFKVAKSLITNYHIKSSTKEATNILIPKAYQERYPRQLFFSPLQLETLKNLGVDISKFDPIESGLWRKPQIASKNFDPKTYSMQGLASLNERLSPQQVQDLLDPDQEISVEYVPSKDSRGETPKINVSYGDDQKWKLKFLTDKSADTPSILNPALAVQKVLISSEVNIEPAVNNLAAAVGFSVDPTYYKKTVRMYFPKEAYEDNFEHYLEEKVVKVLSARFKISWNIRSAFQKVKTDENGKQYIEFKGVNLEKKSDIKTDLNVSFFVRHNLGKSFKREFRALALFQALIADPDVKDDNTKIKLIPAKGRDGEDTFKLAFVAADIGIALGFGFPNIYPKKFVAKVDRYDNGDIKDIKLNYRTFFPFPIFQAVSLADAKWLMRLIAQIPPEKIYTIFRSSGYPEVVAAYYQEIFLHRCDQLYDVLGLVNETFTGSNGEKITIRTKSSITNPKTFSIKGAEHLFFNGKLSDPKNELFNKNEEHFVRNWGTALDKNIEGQHKTEFFNIFTKGLALGAGNFTQQILLDNFQFTNVFSSGPKANPFCKNRCYFVGFKAGIDWFIPMRFIVENPTPSAKEHPYWVVDMFRLAFTLGAGTQSILSKLALSAAPQIVGLGGEFIKGWDFIKIRPVANYADAVGHLKNNDEATRKFFLKDINQQVLEKMQPGDILVGSSYIGSRGALAVQPNNNIFASVTGQTELEIMYLHRTYVLKGHDNKFLTNWANIKSLNLTNSVFLYAMFMRVPVIKSEYKRSTAKHRVYEFDFNDAEAKQELLNNINKTNPTDVDPKYQFQAKTVKSRGSIFTIDAFGLNKLVRSKKRTEVVGQDYILGKDVHEIAYERIKQHKVLKHFEPIDHNKIHIKAQLNSDGNMYAKLDLRYFQNQTYKKDFLKIIKKNQSFLPSDFIVFDPKSVKHYLGEFEINSTMVINSEGINDLFGKNGPDDISICRTYAAVHNIKHDYSDWCQKSMHDNFIGLDKMKARKFVHAFKEIRDAYQNVQNKYVHDQKINLDDKNAKANAYDVLKGIVSILHENKSTQKVIDIFQYHISDKNIFRNVSMWSLLEGFPGLIDTIGNSDASDGGLEPNERHLVINVGDVFKIFTDDIDKALSGKQKE